VWRSSRFGLLDRDVAERLCARGVIVTSEAIRQWCRNFGQDDAHHVRRRRRRPGDTWPLDEVVLTSNGGQPDLWQALDPERHVLDLLVQSRRNTNAAKKFFRTLLKGLT
jgi:putative transposase